MVEKGLYGLCVYALQEIDTNFDAVELIITKLTETSEDDRIIETAIKMLNFLCP